jgi:hypothetical protein
MLLLSRNPRRELTPPPRLVSLALAFAGAARHSAAPVIPVIVPPSRIPAPSVSSLSGATQSTVLPLVAVNRAGADDSSLTQLA